MMARTTRLLGLGGRSHVLKGNQPLVLDDPDKVWAVRSGTLAIFATRLVDGVPEGQRRFLFSLRVDTAAFGVAPGEAAADGHGLLAVAVGECQVQELSLQELCRWAGTGATSATSLVGSWLHEVGDLLGQPAPPDAVKVQEPGSQTVEAEHPVVPSGGAPTWIRLTRGAARYLGRQEHEIGASTAIQPLLQQLWLVPTEATELEIVPPTELQAADRLAEGLASMHALLRAHLGRIDREEEAEEQERMRVRAARLDERTGAALEDLATVLNPRPAIPLRETPLLTVMSHIGDLLHVPVRDIPSSEDRSRMGDPMEAIARASRIRWRRVVLAGDWWKRDCGPMLAYLGEEDREPVALVPRRARYHLVDPRTRCPQPLTRRLAAQLCPDAYAFYRPLPDQLKGLSDLLRFSLRGRMGDLLFIGVCAIIATLLGMLTPHATGLLIDKALPDANRTLVVTLGGGLLAAALGIVLFGLAQAMVTLRTGILADTRTQSAMWDRLLRLRPAFFRRFSTGDLQSRVLAVNQISQQLSGATMRSLLTGTLSVLNLGLLYYYSSELTTIAILTGLAVFVITMVAGFYIRRKALRLQELAGVFFGMVIQMIGNVGKLRVAGAELRAFNHWVRKYTEQLHLVLSIQQLQDWVGLLMAIIPGISTICIYWFGCKLILEPGSEGQGPELQLGVFLAFNSAFGIFVGGITSLSTTLVGLLETITKSRRIQPLLEAEPEVPEDAADPGRLRGGLSLEEVSFRYTEDGPLVLRGVNLEARPGEFIALVGPSGSGKSTVLRILLGFETPTSGSVRYDGQDLAGLDVLAVRRQLGVVLQTGRVNAGSIFTNIAGTSQISFDEAWEAAADAGLADDIQAMPMGLHTIVSEGGTNLSGGQRQRLLIARALAHRPRVIYFDEATSALDNRTQAVVSESLERRRMTRLVIAHRLSTIQHADHIYVLEAGRIVQEGPYADLAAEEGLFQRLIQRQQV